MIIHTIGFSGKSAAEFFTLLKNAGVRLLIDVRRSNNTLYSGFTRQRDLPYFLTQLADIAYVHEPDFAPSLELLRHYQGRLKANRRDPNAWPEFEQQFLNEICHRPVVEEFEQHTAGYTEVCLLCSEATAERCHRRLVAGYLQQHVGNAKIEILHL